jgi:predicted secreted protein
MDEEENLTLSGICHPKIILQHFQSPGCINSRTAMNIKEALKMKKMNVLLMGLVITTAVTATQLTGCGTGSSKNAQTENSAGSAISADLTEGESVTANGKTLKIVYASSPSTGYSWKVSIDHPEVIKAVADDYAQEQDDTGKSTDEVICGAGGYETFAFEGVGKGTAVITLNYAQQWNGGSEGMTRSVSVETDAQGNIVSVK